MSEFRLLELDAPEIKASLDRGEAVLIDVREPEEHAAERIPGATLVPLSSFDPTRIGAIAAGKKVILHCAAGGRSARAAAVLHASGITDVAHLKGGIGTWREAGFAIVTG